MTTAVSIESPYPNHQNLRITRQNYDAAEKRWVETATPEKIISDGERMIDHVYGSCRIVIEEVAKPAKSNDLRAA